MSVTAERRIVDFAEAGAELAQAGPAEFNRGLDALIERLSGDGTLIEIVMYDWIREPEGFDRGSSPRPRKMGCLASLPVVRSILRRSK